jgi:hypothetical protein
MPEPPAPVAFRIWTPLDTIDGDPSYSLQGLNTEFFPDGAVVMVRGGVNALYELRKGSTAAADGSCVVQPGAGPGRWHRYPAAGGATLPWPGSLSCGPLVDGAFREVLPTGDPFSSSVTWYADNTKAIKLLEQLITRNAAQSPTQIQWLVYNSSGVLVQTITDAITYSGSFESTRTRTIT